MDDQLKLDAPWDQVKEKLKEINLSLTDEDLNYTKGQENEMIGRVAKRMDRTPEETKKWIESVSFNKAKAG